MGAIDAVDRILDFHRQVFESDCGPWRRHLISPGFDRGTGALSLLHQLWCALNEALRKDEGIAVLSAKYKRELESIVTPRAMRSVLVQASCVQWQRSDEDYFCRAFSIGNPVPYYVSRDDSEADPLREIAAELEQIRYEPLRRDGSSGPTIATEEPTAATAEFVPGEDFRSVKWGGSSYTFTATQSACVRMLWEAWQRGTPDLAQETLLECAGSNAQRLRDVFKLKGRVNLAWGTLIVPGDRKSTFRLRLAK